MISGWELVIGIEIHAQVKSKSKLFSSSSTEFGSGPNSQVSLVDAAMPGMLPVINKFCVEQAVRSGIGLNAQINKKSIFPVSRFDFFNKGNNKETSNIVRENFIYPFIF